MNLLRKILNSSKLYLSVYGIILGYYVIGLLTNLSNWPVWVGGLVFLVAAFVMVVRCMKAISDAEEAERAYKKARNECLSIRAEYYALIGDIQEFQQRVN